MNPEYDETVKEAAKRLDVHPNTIRQWARDEKIDAKWIPGSWCIKRGAQPTDIKPRGRPRNSS